MFCNEHGTVDYCPECVRDEMGSETDDLKLRINNLESVLAKIIDDAGKAEGDMYAAAYFAEDVAKIDITQITIEEVK